MKGALVRSFWLASKKGKESWIEPIVERKTKTYQFVVRTGAVSHDLKQLVDRGTKMGRGCKFQCLLSGESIPEEFIKAEASAGRLKTRLMAIVVAAGRNRLFLSPDAAQEQLAAELDATAVIPGIDAPLARDPRNLWCLQYGIDRFHKLFTPRQLLALAAFSDLVPECREKVVSDGSVDAASIDSYATAVATYLGEAASKLSTFHNMLAYWRVKESKAALGLGRQAIPMMWDFAEMNPFAGAGGDWETIACDAAPKVISSLPSDAPGVVAQREASTGVYPTNVCVCTDPPYYDNIVYSDLSDFFYVWLRRSLRTSYPDLFTTLVTPKKEELVASPYRFDGDKTRACEFFEAGLGQTFRRIHAAAIDNVPVTVFYAFKQSETDEDNEDTDHVATSTASTGWETMLEGLLAAGFGITGTWPLRTEQTGALKGNVNALASSVVLVCHKRPDEAQVGTRKGVLAALHKELPDALRKLQRGNIAPVDLAQAAIGPGMAVFTRYSKVMESDGKPMTVRTALGLINQSLDEVLAEQEGEFDGDTRWALAWFEQFGMDEGAFGIAETLSKAKNTAVNGLVEAGIIRARAGKVRLVRRDELPDDWNPATDRRLTIWETTQHLIHRLDKQGEAGAATLLHQLGGMAESARDLAYRLYVICERKKWAEDALAYNGLVVTWPELSKLAQSQRRPPAERQGEMF